MDPQSIENKPDNLTVAHLNLIFFRDKEGVARLEGRKDEAFRLSHMRSFWEDEFKKWVIEVNKLDRPVETTQWWIIKWLKGLDMKPDLKFKTTIRQYAEALVNDDKDVAAELGRKMLDIPSIRKSVSDWTM